MSERVEVLEIDLTEIQQEAKDTGKTLKDLRKEVKDLRAQLEDTEMGTNDFTRTLDQLIRKQQELADVTKSGVAAQKGSYNDLVNQMALLKKEWRAAANESERAAIGEKIGSINTRLKELDASLGNYQRNVGNYQGEMGKLATNVDAVGDAAATSAPNIQTFNSNVEGLSNSTENLNTVSTDWVQTADNTVKVAAGLAGAFQVVQGAVNLMGIESEATTKMIAQMQNVMAITQGLKSISEGIEAFGKLKTAVQGAGLMAKIFGTETKVMTVATNAQTVATTGATVATHAFKKALIATGIGAIVVLIGTLIANWEKLAKALGFAKKEQKETNEALKKSIELEKERNAAVSSSVGSVIGKYRLLQEQWKQLKSVNEKNEWIRNNASEFNNLGIAVNDVNAAQNVFITNSAKVIKALKDQARARALAGLYEEAVAKQYKAQQKFNEEEAAAKQKYPKGYKPSDEEAEAAGLTDWDYGGQVRVENNLFSQWFLGKPKSEFKRNTEQVDFSGAQKLRDVVLKPFKTDLEAINAEVGKLEEAYLDAEKVASESVAAVQDAGITVTGGTSGTGGGKSDAEKAAEEAAAAAKALAERQKVIDEELRTYKFDEEQKLLDALIQKRDQWLLDYKGNAAKEAEINQWYTDEKKKIEDKFEEERKAKRKEIEEEMRLSSLSDEDKLIDALKQKKEKWLKEYEGDTKENAEKRKAIEQWYDKEVEKIEKQRTDRQKQAIAEQIDAINKRYQSALEVAKIQQEISTIAAENAGDEVSVARALQTMLIAQNNALVTQRDELLAYKAELEAAGKSVIEVTEALKKNNEEMETNSKNRAQAYAEEAAAELSLINNIIGSVSDSMDQLLALDLGGKWADELGIAFNAIQDGLTKTGDALKSGQKGWQAYGQMAAAGLYAASSILTSIAEEQDEQTEEGFEKQKKLQIAAATMSMLGGVVSAMTSAFNPANAWMTIWGQAAAAAAMSALVITTGALQIANIKKQTMDSSASSASTPAIPSLSAINAIGNPVQTTTNIEGASTEGATSDTRVYVLESDITSAQNNVKTTVEEATF